jgi:hypothetical protein
MLVKKTGSHLMGTKTNAVIMHDFVTETLQWQLRHYAQRNANSSRTKENTPPDNKLQVNNLTYFKCPNTQEQSVLTYRTFT